MKKSISFELYKLKKRKIIPVFALMTGIIIIIAAFTSNINGFIIKLSMSNFAYTVLSGVIYIALPLMSFMICSDGIGLGIAAAFSSIIYISDSCVQIPARHKYSVGKSGDRSGGAFKLDIAFCGSRHDQNGQQRELNGHVYILKRHWINGWQYDSKEDFVEKLKYYIRSKEPRCSLRRNSVKAGELYSVGTFAKNMESIYEEVIHLFESSGRDAV